jgi:hypothetical protein
MTLLQMAEATAYHVYGGTELRNIMDRFIQHVKEDRTECFDDHFPCRNRQDDVTGSMSLELVEIIHSYTISLHAGIDRIYGL